MFKTAIVGCGAISKTHAEALKSVENTEITAFCDTNKEKLDTRIQEYGGNGYSSLEEMLEKEKPDVLHICTPHYLHVPMALTALKKNVNVLMEKPPAISHEQFEELKNAVDSSKTRLGLCFQNRYNDSVVKAKSILESGVLGKVIGARAIVTWSRNDVYYTKSGWRGELKKEGGGVLINQSIHTLDLATYLFGTPTEITANSANYHLKGIIDEEDTISAFLRYPDKNVIFFATTAYCKDAPILLEIICENGSLQLEGNTLKITQADQKPEFTDYTVRNESGKACWGTSHKKLIQDFYNCLETNMPFPVTLESAKPSFDSMMAIYDSAKTNKTITLGV
ncbi:MAG: Gfo/Idh/MocA family oxidoreductase [Clostridia bacterium]|nr:Gfo/Idh/MocA family oxidoreductase [Clostridia bacterium]